MANKESWHIYYPKAVLILAYKTPPRVMLVFTKNAWPFHGRPPLQAFLHREPSHRHDLSFPMQNSETSGF